MLTDIRVVCLHGYLQVVLQLGGRVTESVNECTHLVASRVSVHVGVGGASIHTGGGVKEGAPLCEYLFPFFHVHMYRGGGGG